MPVKPEGHSLQRIEGWRHMGTSCQSPGTGCVPEGDTALAGDMGWGPGAAKMGKPQVLNFASTLVLMLNHWQDCCRTGVGEEEGIFPIIEPGGF